MPHLIIQSMMVKSKTMSKVNLKHELTAAAIPAAYTAAASAFAWVATGLHPLAIEEAIESAVFVQLMLLLVGLAGCLLGGMVRGEPPRDPLRLWAARAPVAVGFLLFLPAFAAVKISIPAIAPFSMDGVLEDIDRWLHLGVDPWRPLHALEIFSNWALFDLVYLKLYSVVLLATIVTLAFFEANSWRRFRYLALFVLAWAVLGNVLALAVPSAGPIFLERLTGDATFRPLMDSLLQHGYAASHFHATQEYLWNSYVGDLRRFGSGISAFPSVHVGTATVTALYAAERWRVLAVPGWLFVAAILIGSVYCGYHYAVDGYAAIAVVVAMNWALRRGADAVWRPTVVIPAVGGEDD